MAALVTKNGRLIGSWHWQFGSWILFDSCFLGNFCLIFIKIISKYSKLTNIKHQTWRHGSNGANIPQLYDYRTLHVYWEVSRWNIQGSFYITNPNKPLLFSGSPWKLSYICIKFDTPRVSLNYPGQPTAYTAKSTGVRLLSKASQGPSLWFSWGWRCRCLLAGKTIVLFHRWDMLLPRRVDLHDLHHLFQRISFTICKTRPCMWLSWQLHKIPVTSPIDGWSREIYRPFRNQFDENIHIIKHLYRNVKKINSAGKTWHQTTVFACFCYFMILLWAMCIIAACSHRSPSWMPKVPLQSLWLVAVHHFHPVKGGRPKCIWWPLYVSPCHLSHTGNEIDHIVSVPSGNCFTYFRWVPDRLHFGGLILH